MYNKGPNTNVKAGFILTLPGVCMLLLYEIKRAQCTVSVLQTKHPDALFFLISGDFNQSCLAL